MVIYFINLKYYSFTKHTCFPINYQYLITINFKFSMTAIYTRFNICLNSSTLIRSLKKITSSENEECGLIVLN